VNQEESEQYEVDGTKKNERHSTWTGLTVFAFVFVLVSSF